MKTEDLIQNLSQEARPSAGADSVAKFLLKISAYWLVLGALTWWFLPERADLNLALSRPTFYVETWLWLATALTSAVLVYRHSLPGLAIDRTQQITLFLMMSLVLIVPFASDESGLPLSRELNLERGLCGIMILAMGIMGSVFFFRWSRKLLPDGYSRTGFWIAVSSAAFGSFVMQLVCAHNTSLHLYIWHFLPALFLGWVSSLVAKRLLKW